MPSDKNSSNDIMIPQKYLDKIVKLQQDQDKARQEEYALLREHISQTNDLLSELVKVSATGSTVAATKKIIPFHTGSQQVGQLIIPPSIDTPPPNPDDYPTQINIYAQNDNRPIQHMTLINDGPGQIFYVVGYSQTDVNRKEGHLNVNDQRELFNVYQVRLRSTLPLTTFRLIEGIFRTGSFAPQTKANVEIRPTLQANEIIKTFVAQFEIAFPTLTINSPIPVTFNLLNINPAIQNPLPPGQTAMFIDNVTGFPLPFKIPEGFILESFLIADNMSTDHTLSGFLEFVPGTFTPVVSFPISNRGAILNLQLNLSGVATTEVVDPFGAPSGGRDILFVVTNDDPFNNMIGSIIFLAVLRRLT